MLEKSKKILNLMALAIDVFVIDILGFSVTARWDDWLGFCRNNLPAKLVGIVSFVGQNSLTFHT